MKKWILGILIVTLLATVGYVVVDAHPFTYDPNTDPDGNPVNTEYYPYYRHGGMMGARGGYCFDGDDAYDYDYEFLYTHLSSEDKLIIDEMYASGLAEIDYANLTDEEVMTAIDLLKDELANYIIENDMFTYGNPYWD